MPESVTFTDPSGQRKPIALDTFEVPGDLPDFEQRSGKIPEPDPHYVDLGMLYKLAALERVRRTRVTDTPLHVALRAHGYRQGPRSRAIRRSAPPPVLPHSPHRRGARHHTHRFGEVVRGRQGAVPRAAGKTATSPGRCAVQR